MDVLACRWACCYSCRCCCCPVQLAPHFQHACPGPRVWGGPEQCSSSLLSIFLAGQSSFLQGKAHSCSGHGSCPLSLDATFNPAAQPPLPGCPTQLRQRQRPPLRRRCVLERSCGARRASRRSVWRHAHLHWCSAPVRARHHSCVYGDLTRSRATPSPRSAARAPRSGASRSASRPRRAQQQRASQRRRTAARATTTRPRPRRSARCGRLISSSGREEGRRSIQTLLPTRRLHGSAQAEFKPIVQLEEVETSTGEEDEEVLLEW